MRYLACLSFVFVIVLAGCDTDADEEEEAGPPNPFEGFESEQYTGTENWLCHPDLTNDQNACRENLDATVIYADGSTEIQEHTPAADPPVDCFYVYPTTSQDVSGNSDLTTGGEEETTTLAQAARYNAECRLFAPVYRQRTSAALFSPALSGDLELAYDDVLAAFKQYVAQENDGRGFLLVGHSQGSRHLARLIAEEIESNAYLSERMVSAHLMGVPSNAAVFPELPACDAETDTGCLVSYASYRAGDPDLAATDETAAIFGRLINVERAPVCVNPAAPGSDGPAPTEPYFPTSRSGAVAEVIATGSPFVNPEDAPDINTPFYTMPGFVSAECASSPTGATYLEVAATPAPDDARAVFGGEFLLAEGWGLHFLDVSLAQGDLVELAGRQAAAWEAP